MTIPVVFVQVRNAKFSYLNHLDDLKPGDKVVVPFGDTFQVGEVAGVPKTDEQASRATKWIVSKVEGLEKWETLTALRPPPERKKVEIRWYHAEAIKAIIRDGETIKFKRPV